MGDHAIRDTRCGDGESGQALVIALLALTLGVLLVTPFLYYASTSQRTTIAAHEQTKDRVSADAGVEKALWCLQRELITTTEQFSISINHRAVDVTVEDEGEGVYKITSTATRADGDSTTIESSVEDIPEGNLDLFESALASEGDITLGEEDNRVTGTIYCEGQFDPGEDLVHDGDVITRGYEWPEDTKNEAFARQYREEAGTGGITTGLTIDSDTELGPIVIDGDLDIGEEVVITLTGTIYVSGTIEAEEDLKVTGSGSIVATDYITLAEQSDYDTEGSSVIMSLNGDVTFEEEATVTALIYAPGLDDDGGTVTFNEEADITGSVVAGEEIESDKESTFTYEPVPPQLQLPGYNSGALRVRTYDINP